MNGTKAWYASRGVWGSLMAFLGSAIILWNTTVGASNPVPEEVTQQVSDPNTVVAFVAVGTLVGSILSWIGRVFASSKIG